MKLYLLKGGKKEKRKNLNSTAIPPGREGEPELGDLNLLVREFQVPSTISHQPHSDSTFQDIDFPFYGAPRYTIGSDPQPWKATFSAMQELMEAC